MPNDSMAVTDRVLLCACLRTAIGRVQCGVRCLLPTGRWGVVMGFYTLLRGNFVTVCDPVKGYVILDAAQQAQIMPVIGSA